MLTDDSLVCAVAPSREREYWTRHLADLPLVHNLPLDHPRPMRLGRSVLREQRTVEPHVLAGLETLCAEQGADVLTGLQAAFAVAVARASGESDIAIGLASMLPIRALVLRNDIAAGRDFRTILAESIVRLGEADANAAIAWDPLLRAARVQATQAHAPLFQLELRYRGDEGERCAKRSPAQNIAANPTPIADVVLDAVRRGDGLSLEWICAADLFSIDGIQRMARHFLRLLEAVVNAPDRDVWRLPMMDADERRVVVHEWNATRVAAPCLPIHLAFDAQVARTPHAIALSCGAKALRYVELAARANRMAHHLREIGVGPGDTVGVCLERTSDLVVSLLAVLKAGAAYVPLDPGYPQDRIEFMLADSGAVCVLAQTATLARVGEARKVVIDTPALRGHLAGLPDTAPDVAVAPEALAYLIYTSGSTGRPKGVCIEHRQASAFIEWVRGAFDAEALSGVLATTSVCFDLSIFELFATLACGGRAILVRDPLDFAGISAAEGITLINTVPSAIKVLVEERRVPATVRIVNLAGEALPPSLVRDIYRRTGVEAVYNLYGPSEDTTYSTWARMAPDATIAPIGRPLDNGRVYVLDRHGEPVPIGIAGEIHVAGAGVARGYWNRPELTAERFMADPFHPDLDGRMYRTGDLGRWLPSGELEFLGRVDHQIKLRGFRVELGEIQECLQRLDQVAQALVVAVDMDDGDRRLAAYVVPAAPGMDWKGVISCCRAHLEASLPYYMVPSAFTVLERIPLTPNGKVDRRALPVPVPDVVDAHVAPESPLEILLTDLWAQTLGVDRVGLDSDFFVLGGHSMLMVLLVAKIRAAIPGRSPPQLAMCRTVREQAMLLTEAVGSRRKAAR